MAAVEMYYVGRNPDTKAIYGLWTVCQWKDQEELKATDPEVVTFLDRKPKKPTTAQVMAGFGITVDDMKAWLAGK